MEPEQPSLSTDVKCCNHRCYCKAPSTYSLRFDVWMITPSTSCALSLYKTSQPGKPTSSDHAS
eukprot:2504291-Amphidinium_carterae.1